MLTITDADDEDVFPMMSANVTVVGTVDGNVQTSSVTNDTALELLGLGVSSEFYVI